MRITGARVAVDARSARHCDFQIRDGKLSFQAGPHHSAVLDLSGLLVLPGLINAHDHLEFNLLPRLGTRLYPNAKTWATEIYHPRRSPLREHLSIPKRVRLYWGGVKNLVSGVTTVAHHNSVCDPAFDDAFPVKIVKTCGWAHSLEFCPDLVQRFQSTAPAWPFIIHAAEGTDEFARAEVRELAVLGVLSGRTILVHGIGIDLADKQILCAHGCSIVWCPTSNIQTYGKTLNPAIADGLPILLGTDSAITGQVDLIDEIRTATEFGRTNEQLFEMVTVQAARALRLKSGEGELREGGVADFIAVRDWGQTPAEALSGISAEVVVVAGKLRLISKPQSGRLPASLLAGFQEIHIGGRGHFLTSVDMDWLRRETVPVLGSSLLLAGKQVLPC